MRDLGCWKSRSFGWGGHSRGPKGERLGVRLPGLKAPVPGSQASASPTHLSSWRTADPQSAWRGWSAPSASAAHIRPPPEPRTPGPKARQPSPPCLFPRLAPRARGGEEGDGRGSEARSLRPSRARQVGPRRSPAPVLAPQARVGAPAPCPPQTRGPAPRPLLVGLGQPQGSPGPAYLASSSRILRWTWTSSSQTQCWTQVFGSIDFSLFPGARAHSLPGVPGCAESGHAPAARDGPWTPGPGGEEDSPPSASPSRWG